jgi:hypothetical protein
MNLKHGLMQVFGRFLSINPVGFTSFVQTFVNQLVEQNPGFELIFGRFFSENTRFQQV